MIYVALFSLCVIIAIVLFSLLFKKEGFCGNTGLTYDQGPLPNPIREEAKEPPFYETGVARKSLCSYRNYTFPPPMNYGSFENNSPELEKQYLYWNTAVLSHPQTCYLV